jgi:hypothetical protein
LPIQLTEQHFARRLAWLASLPLPDNVVKEAIGRFVETNGFSQSKQGREANGRTPARRGAAMLTGIKQAVLKVIPQLEGNFTYHEIQRGFEHIKYLPDTKNPASSIGRVLRALTKETKVVLVQKGTAGEPSIFKKAQAH